jgi:hypothetical protein
VISSFIIISDTDHRYFSDFSPELSVDSIPIVLINVQV